MQYNVAPLLKEPIGSHRSYRLDETLAGPAPLEGQVCGQVDLMHTHQGVLVSAKVEAPVTLSCSRCVTSFHTPVRLTVEEEFFPTVDVNTGHFVPLPADADPAFRIDAGHVLDLTEVLRQCLITETPMKPLCQPQCLGLCRECGANLNLGGCGCGAGRGDPRWGALRALLEPQQA
jgi:uncharacterized protein